MKIKLAVIALTAVLGAAANVASADQWVKGYLRSDGTYVAPHFRSSPNSSKFDNHSSQGNTNPYTGQRGYQRHEFSTPRAFSYGSSIWDN